MSKRTLISLASFCFLLLILPGFNTIQQYQVHSSTDTSQRIHEAPFEVPTRATIPVHKPSQLGQQSQLSALLQLGQQSQPSKSKPNELQQNELQPNEPSQVLEPSLTAQAAIVIDRESGSILYEKNADTRLYPASITKIMTGLVAMETYQLNEVLTVTDESKAIGNTVQLRDGERMTVGNLLKGLLIASGNDAAYVLANSSPGGYDKFVEKMNEKAQAWNMKNTTFLNVSGVEQEGHLTTVRDLATLTKKAMENELFRETVKTPYAEITDTTGSVVHKLYSTNKLLGTVPGIEGVKTGWTTQAGECLITQTTRDGHTIITVVLGSQDRFGESAKLIEWAFANYDWQTFSFDQE